MEYYLFDISSNKIIAFKAEQVVDSLYYQKTTIPTEKNINKSKNKLVKEYFKKYTINDLKNAISKLDYVIPLYDIYHENLFIIKRENVYHRVVYDYYRFPDKYFIEYIKKKIKDKTSNIDEKLDILEKRKIKKLQYMYTFLNYFDLNELFNTYVRVFYLYANEVGKDITLCQRPSFLSHFKHLKPYYSRKEVINLALNMGIKLDKNTYYDQDKINELCQVVRNNDISCKTLLEHQKYMIKQDKVGLVQYYSLRGSYVINQYLRNLEGDKFKNKYLEHNIKNMWELVYHSPPFHKEYILYRFIKDDNYLRNLNIGDTFYDKGFTSTTRDPFYKPDEFKFGFILIKIKIPPEIEGVGLCIETLSYFPKEQEIILPPNSLLRLDKKNKDCEYYNSDMDYASQIKTKYEFTFIKKTEIKFEKKPEYEINDITIDFLNIKKINNSNIIEQTEYFIRNYIYPYPHNQFKSIIGDKEFTFIFDYYNSTGVYRDFYAIITTKGFHMYSIYNNYIIISIEIGDFKGDNFMYINYANMYTTINRVDIISDEDFILFISKIANYFSINKVVIMADFISCDIMLYKNKIINKKHKLINLKSREDQITDNKLIGLEEDQIANNNKFVGLEEDQYYGGKYCIDFYNYMKYNIKKFTDSKLLSSEIYPKFSYYSLDKLKEISPLKILNVNDPDELYIIYDKLYKDNHKDNLWDFYIWIIEHKCYLIQFLTEKFDRIFTQNNPFRLNYYLLNPDVFLYNRKYITTVKLFSPEKILEEIGFDKYIEKINIIPGRTINERR